MQFLLVETGQVPGEDLNPEAVEAASGVLRSKASVIRDRGADYVTAWQRIGEHHEAPGTQRLLASMDPVRDTAALIAQDTHAVCDHLDAHAAELRALRDRRRALVADIAGFRDRVATETDGLGGLVADVGLSLTLPPRLMAENTALLHRVTTLGNEITAAREDCAARIRKVGAPAPAGLGHQLVDALGDGAGWVADTFGWGESDDAERFTEDFLNGLMNGNPALTLPGLPIPGSAIGPGLGGVVLAGLAGWGARGLDDAGAWFDGLVDDIGTGIGTGIDDGREWIGDTAADVGDWFTDRGTDISDWYEDTETAVDDWFETWPKTAELGARAALAWGHAMNALGPLFDQSSVPLPSLPPLFVDGTAHAGEPVPWKASDDPADHELPFDLAGLTGAVDETYQDAESWPDREQATKGLVRFTIIDGDPPRVIVSVPGTMEWSPAAGDNPMDLTSDLSTMDGSGQSTITDAVRLAMENANIPPGAEVMMVGHSLGGIVVGDLMSDPDFAEEYNVRQAMTFGSPIDTFDFPPGTNVTQFAHSNDLVPKVDLNDDRIGFGTPTPDNGSDVITLDPPGPVWEGMLGHMNYTQTMEENGDPRLDAYEQELRDAGFLIDPEQADDARVEYVPVERKFDQ